MCWLTKDSDLYKVESLEKWSDKGGGEGEEVGDFVLKCRVVVLVFLSGDFEVLLELEQVLLIRQRLLLLVLELEVTVVEPVIVQQLNTINTTLSNSCVSSRDLRDRVPGGD